MSHVFSVQHCTVQLPASVFTALWSVLRPLLLLHWCGLTTGRVTGVISTSTEDNNLLPKHKVAMAWSLLGIWLGIDPV